MANHRLWVSGARLPPPPDSNTSTVLGTATALGETLATLIDPRSAPAPGTSQLGDRYAVGERMGAGGMGIVVSAQDLALGRTVAVKIALAPPGAQGQDLARRFRAEAQITGQLEHPNIVPVHELGEDRTGRPYFTMKRIEGMTLAEWIEDVRRGGRSASDYSLTRVLHVVLKVCEALEFAHSRGVLHRDLKPSNLMIGSFGEVMVMDWGLAKVRAPGVTPSTAGAGGVPVPNATSASRQVGASAPTAAACAPETATLNVLEHDRTRVGAVVGTLEYMPPEQARGRVDELDERSDVYSLGAVLYQLTTLSPPFQATSAQALWQRVVEGHPLPPRSAARRFVPPRPAATFETTRTASPPPVSLPSSPAPEAKDAAPGCALPAGGAPTPAPASAGPAGPSAGRFPVRVEVPAEVEAIILKAMALAPADRYPSVEALRRDLLCYLEGQPVSALPAGPFRRAAKWVRRHPSVGAALLTAAALLLVGGVLAVALWRDRERERFELLERSLRAEGAAASEARRRNEVLEERRKHDEARARAYEQYLKAAEARDNRRPVEVEVEAFAAATRLDPSFSEAWVGLGEALGRAGRGRDAAETFEKAARVAAERGAVELQARCLYYAGRMREREPGEADAALARYREAARLSPDGVYGHLGQAHLLAVLGRFDEALREAEKARDLDARFWEAHDLIAYLLGQPQLTIGGPPNPLHDTRKALASLDRAIELRDGEPILYANRAVLHFQLAQLELAEADAKRALALLPSYGEAWLLLGAIRRQQNRLEEALQAYGRALALAPARVELHFNRAFVYFALGRLREALDDYDRFVAAVPKSREGRGRRAVVRLRLGDPKGAKEDLEAMLAIDGEVADSYFAATNLALEGAAVPLALELADRGLDRHAESASLRRVRGVARLRAGNEAGAREDFDADARLSGGDAGAFRRVGDAVYREGRHALAAEWYAKLLALDPKDVDALFHLAGCAYHAHDYDGAIAYFTRVLAEKPDDLEARMYRGCAYREKGALAEADADLDEVLALSPEHQEALFERGVLRWKVGRMGLALEDLNRVLARDPRHARAYHYRGLVRQDRREVRSAETDFRRSVSLGYADAVPALARLLAGRGDLDGARTVLQDGIRRFPEFRAVLEEELRGVEGRGAGGK
ncbi:MAG: tetratricopeptide repeat protein [Planctomycetes bacterium]|nr:tetratricopeptide repeat protein [Planctomycetota bacterium]